MNQKLKKLLNKILGVKIDEKGNAILDEKGNVTFNDIDENEIRLLNRNSSKKEFEDAEQYEKLERKTELFEFLDEYFETRKNNEIK